jgi:hypothetical protein
MFDTVPPGNSKWTELLMSVRCCGCSEWWCSRCRTGCTLASFRIEVDLAASGLMQTHSSSRRVGKDMHVGTHRVQTFASWLGARMQTVLMHVFVHVWTLV